ncbi:MAG: HAD family hydrolase [Clostridia bacterium]|nr:HAD family hydrolase [Clostridia bacterium]
MNFKYIVFDLDGTLTEPKEGITKSIQYALSKMGIEVSDLESLTKYIGPPLIPCFMQDFDMTEEEATKALMFYRERFIKTGMFENVMYDGIKELLESLKKAGKTVILATTKPTPQAEGVLNYFKLTEYFDVIGGSNLSGTVVEKPDVMREAFKQVENIDLTKAVMVGDRKYDVAGAKAHNIPCIGVLYGHGSRKELEEAGADMLVGSVEELSQILLKSV